MTQIGILHTQTHLRRVSSIPSIPSSIPADQPTSLKTPSSPSSLNSRSCPKTSNTVFHAVPSMTEEGTPFLSLFCVVDTDVSGTRQERSPRGWGGEGGWVLLTEGDFPLFQNTLFEKRPLISRCVTTSRKTPLKEHRNPLC